MEENLQEKLDRNYETYNKLLSIIQTMHSQPSPDTVKAIQALSDQMEKVSLVLEKIVIMLNKNV